VRHAEEGRLSESLTGDTDQNGTNEKRESLVKSKRHAKRLAVIY